MTDHAALESAMRRALEIAGTHRFRVEPNPCVGAVVLSADGRVVGEGATEPYGGRHAEIVALAAAGAAAQGGTLVATLEPCAHDAKKTPPCVPAILAAGVSRVIAGSADPNPATAGRARAAFEAEGVTYGAGIESVETDRSLARYAAHLATGLPWTVLKWAMSADGRSADSRGHSRFISGPAARDVVHEMRARVEAIVVGVGTVVADDPSLTCRVPHEHDPLRVVFDSSLRIPLEARVVRDARTTRSLVVTCADDDARTLRLTERGVEVERVAAGADGRVDLRSAFERLAARGVRRVLAEPGGQLAAGLVEHGLVRQVMAFTAPLLIGGAGAPGPIGGEGLAVERALRLEEPRWSTVGEDGLLEGYLPV